MFLSLLLCFMLFFEFVLDVHTIFTISYTLIDLFFLIATYQEEEEEKEEEEKEEEEEEKEKKKKRMGSFNHNLRVAVILSKEESDPTKHNILMELKWLTMGSQSGDSLVFYYTGHGSHVPDYNGDEIDKRDEAICPVDYRASGKIVDVELNAIVE
ncbi:hypothetical protein Hdeb2414_s0004g00141851 [Helianthus debilis subsp. tardiflorus]